MTAIDKSLADFLMVIQTPEDTNPVYKLEGDIVKFRVLLDGEIRWVKLEVEKEQEDD